MRETATTEELETFAAVHGISALLDHLGLDGLGNEVNALVLHRAKLLERVDGLEEQIVRALALTSSVDGHQLIRNLQARDLLTSALRNSRSLT